MRPDDSMKQCKHPRSEGGIGRLSAAGEVELHSERTTRTTSNITRASGVPRISCCHRKQISGGAMPKSSRVYWCLLVAVLVCRCGSEPLLVSLNRATLAVIAISAIVTNSVLVSRSAVITITIRWVLTCVEALPRGRRCGQRRGLRPVSHNARKQRCKQPHQPYVEASHRKEDHQEQASESTHLALKSGGLPSRGGRVGVRVRGGASWRRQRTPRGRRGVVRQRRRWRGRRWRGCGRWRQRRRGRRLEPLVTVGAVAVGAIALLLRAICPDERREPEKQHGREVSALHPLHPLQRHTVRFRRFLHGVPRSILSRVCLDVRERELDVGVTDRARIEELL